LVVALRDGIEAAKEAALDEVFADAEREAGELQLACVQARWDRDEGFRRLNEQGVPYWRIARGAGLAAITVRNAMHRHAGRRHQRPERVKVRKVLSTD
jgi:hypothetical protein